jgi:hypothetical protein
VLAAHVRGAAPNEVTVTTLPWLLHGVIEWAV